MTTYRMTGRTDGSGEGVGGRPAERRNEVRRECRRRGRRATRSQDAQQLLSVRQDNRSGRDGGRQIMKIELELGLRDADSDLDLLVVAVVLCVVVPEQEAVVSEVTAGMGDARFNTVTDVQVQAQHSR